MLGRLIRLLDLRPGEGRTVIRTFSVLFLVIGGHTMLETARDALFLTRLPARQLNLVYIALAGLSFFVASGSARLASRFGRRNALFGTLCVAAIATTLLYAGSPTPRAVMALYVISGLIGAALTAQFWLLTAQLFTSAQGRRLFGPIASGGVIGGLVGAGSAAVVVSAMAVASLLLCAAGAFVAAAAILTTLDASEAAPAREAASNGEELDPEQVDRPSTVTNLRPYVGRVALLVGLATGGVLIVDYLFKSTAAHAIPPARLGVFFARYYAVMNAASLVVQLLVASRVIRRLGVAGASGVMPALVLVGALATFVSGGALLPVLATRLVDGSLRHSLNRVAMELLYLPMPTGVRERAKSLIDTVLTRLVQAGVAGVLFAFGRVLTPRLLAAVVVAVGSVWLLVALGIRRPYLDLFRRALTQGTLAMDDEGSEIDVNAAEALVEAMAHPEPTHVVAALDVLEQRQRAKLIPALILYHDAEIVLRRALEIFGRSQRDDWISLGERLLSHPVVAVRISAIRALARRGVATALSRATADASAEVQAYAIYHLAIAVPDLDLRTSPALTALLDAPGHAGEQGRQVLLSAIADAPDPRAIPIVLAVLEGSSFRDPRVDVSLAARAMEALPDSRYIPHCVARLAHRPGREAIRSALVALGPPALAALTAALDDPDTTRRVRVHAPWAIAEHQTQAACDVLEARLTRERETDGFVRYKVLRALGHIVAQTDVRVDRLAIERLALQTLIEHLRLASLRIALSRDGDLGREEDRAMSMLSGLLESKSAQAIERAFRLLKIAHRREDIHRVHTASTSSDRKARSDAGEFLDTLLSRRDQADLRAAFRLVVDDLAPADLASRAGVFTGPLPSDRHGALDLLIADRDEALAVLASYCGLSLGVERLRVTVERTRQTRPSLGALFEHFMPSVAVEESG